MTEKKDKVYLYTDTIRIKELTRQYVFNIDILNSIVQEIENNITRKPLSEKEMHSLCNDTTTFIDNLKLSIKEMFPYPMAKDSYNLDALGIEYQKLNDLQAKLKTRHNPCTIESGKFIESEEYLNTITESCKRYAETDQQKKVLKLLTQIVDATNKLIDHDQDRSVIVSSIRYYLDRQFNLLVSFNNDIGKYVIDYTRILTI